MRKQVLERQAGVLARNAYRNGLEPCDSETPISWPGNAIARFERLAAPPAVHAPPALVCRLELNVRASSPENLRLLRASLFSLLLASACFYSPTVSEPITDSTTGMTASTPVSTTDPVPTSTITTGTDGDSTATIATTTGTTTMEPTIGTSDGTANTTESSPDCSPDTPLLVGVPGTISFITDATVFSNGDIAIAGAYAGDLGLGDLEATESDGFISPFVARIACDGKVIWARRVDTCGGNNTIPHALRLTRESEDVVITGRSLANDIVVWHDGTGAVRGDPSTQCLPSGYLVQGLAPLGSAAAVVGYQFQAQSFALARYEDGEQVNGQNTLFGHPTAITTTSEGDLLVAEITIQGDLRVVKYLDDLAIVGHLGLLIGPLKAPTLADEPIERTGNFIAREESTDRIAVSVRGNGNVNVLIDDVLQDTLLDCNDRAILVIIDTVPSTQLVLATCFPSALFEIRTLRFIDDRLVLAGLFQGPQPVPAFMVLDPPYDSDVIVSAELIKESNDVWSRGIFAQIIPIADHWLIAGGFPAAQMNLLGLEFIAEEAPLIGHKENLFLGRVTP
jgi:hypothetical protein